MTRVLMVLTILELVFSAGHAVHSRLLFNEAQAAPGISAGMVLWLLLPCLVFGGLSCCVFRYARSVWGVGLQWVVVSVVTGLSWITYTNLVDLPHRDGAATVFVGNPLLLLIVGALVQGVLGGIILYINRPRKSPPNAVEIHHGQA